MTDAQQDLVGRLRAAGCVFAEDEATLLGAAAGDATELTALADRRIAGEPLEHLLGWVDFAGLRLGIEAGVFVPRQRTALLAERAAELAAAYERAEVVDLCCGCGAVAAVVAERVPGAHVHAADVDEAAVANARRNLEPRGATALAGDLYDALPRALLGRVDVLTVNAPYVPTPALASLPPEARDHEPRRALDGGPDGLDVHRRVLDDVRRWLAPGAHLLIEAAPAQTRTALALMVGAGLEPWVEHDDERGATVVLARQHGLAPGLVVSHI